MGIVIDRKIPNRLYKYRDFSNHTLDMILSDNVYFADPITFNDPLDTRPSLEIDLDESQLEDIVRRLVERSTRIQMEAAADTIGYHGPDTMAHIKRQSRRKADRLIEEIDYHATNPYYDSEDRKRFLLGHYIEKELLRQYDKGVVSLAERVTCPLMWSHYGDQHRGVCIGYSVPPSADDLYKVKYGGSRLIETSKVAAMLNGDDTARVQVYEAVLLRKARSWSYEREWRLIGRRGLRDSPLEMEEIIFGMRCTQSAKYAVMKVMQNRERPVKYYEMREVAGTFRLRKFAFNKDDQLCVYFPRRALTIIEAFQDYTTSPKQKR